MNITEMHLAWKLEQDKTAALELPAFEPEEIDFWLNNGIRRFVKNRFLGTDKKSKDIKPKGFEETLKRTEDLKSLIVEEAITGVNLIDGVIKPNSHIALLSALTGVKWFTISEEVDISFIDLRTNALAIKRQGVTSCTADTYRSSIDDPYSEHRLHYEEAKPLRLVYQDEIELVTDGNYTITSYYIRYLNKPIDVSLLGLVDCDLPEHTHDEIVKLSVNMALENIEQPRYQSHANELSNVE